MSRPWLGHGSTLFLELGELVVNDQGARQGSATMMLDCDWHLGGTGMGPVGRNDPVDTIADEIALLTNQRIATVATNATDFSLSIALENGRWVRAFHQAASDSSWTVFLPDGWWITIEREQLVVQRGIGTLHDRAV